MTRSGLGVVLALSEEFCKAAYLQLKDRLHVTMMGTKQAIVQPRDGHCSEPARA